MEESRKRRKGEQEENVSSSGPTLKRRKEEKQEFSWTDTLLPIELTQMILFNVIGEGGDQGSDQTNPERVTDKQKPLKEREGSIMGLICQQVCAWWRVA